MRQPDRRTYEDLADYIVRALIEHRQPGLLDDEPELLVFRPDELRGLLRDLPVIPTLPRAAVLEASLRQAYAENDAIRLMCGRLISMIQRGTPYPIERLALDRKLPEGDDRAA